MLQRNDVTLEIMNPEAAGLALEGVHQCIRIEPALAPRSESGPGNPVKIEPGKLFLNRNRIEQVNAASVACLLLVVLTQNLKSFRPGEEQIAALAKSGIRAFPVNGEIFREIGHEVMAEKADLDVLRIGKLLTDAAGRPGRRCRLVGRVPFDHGYRAGRRRVGGKKIRNRAADHATPDDDDIAVLVICQDAVLREIRGTYHLPHILESRARPVRSAQVPGVAQPEKLH